MKMTMTMTRKRFPTRRVLVAAVCTVALLSCTVSASSKSPSKRRNSLVGQDALSPEQLRNLQKIRKGLKERVQLPRESSKPKSKPKRKRRASVGKSSISTMQKLQSAADKKKAKAKAEKKKKILATKKRLSDLIHKKSVNNSKNRKTIATIIEQQYAAHTREILNQYVEEEEQKCKQYWKSGIAKGNKVHVLGEKAFTKDGPATVVKSVYRNGTYMTTLKNSNDETRVFDHTHIHKHDYSPTPRTYKKGTDKHKINYDKNVTKKLELLEFTVTKPEANVESTTPVKIRVNRELSDGFKTSPDKRKNQARDLLKYQKKGMTGAEEMVKQRSAWRSTNPASAVFSSPGSAKKATSNKFIEYKLTQKTHLKAKTLKKISQLKNSGDDADVHESKTLQKVLSEFEKAENFKGPKLCGDKNETQSVTSGGFKLTRTVKGSWNKDSKKVVWTLKHAVENVVLHRQTVPIKLSKSDKKLWSDFFKKTKGERANNEGFKALRKSLREHCSVLPKWLS